jgi:murein DD-endopeptidase MepM/ murein hydrolase activator NlpD
MGKILLLLSTICIISLLTACQPIKENDLGMKISTFETQTQPIPSNIPTPSSSLNPPSRIITTQGWSTLPITPSIEPSQETPTPIKTPAIMCSPLFQESLTSIWEIITYPYNYPPPGREDFHHGVDFAYYRRGDRMSIEGEIIQSIFPGIVSASVNDRLPYGNMVIVETPLDLLPNMVVESIGIQDGESLYSLYAHMGESPAVSLGDIVSCGQSLGAVGKTGYDIVNPHLHLEMRIGPAGSTFNSMVFYDTSATIEEMDNYRRWRTSGIFRSLDPMEVIAEYLTQQIPGFQTPIP